MTTKPVPVTIVGDTAAKKTTKKPKFTVSGKKSAWKRLDVTGNGNKYRYVRFKFVCPTYDDANNIIECLYTEKVINWSYVSAQQIRTADETGGKDFIAVHGILRVENYSAYDWKWFRGRWPHAFFKYGYYPENSYPKMQQPQGDGTSVQVETQKVGAPLGPNVQTYSDPSSGSTYTVTVDAEGDV